MLVAFAASLVVGIAVMFVANWLSPRTRNRRQVTLCIIAFGFAITLSSVGFMGLWAVTWKDAPKGADGTPQTVVDVLFGRNRPDRFEVLEDRYHVAINEPGRWSQNPSRWLIDNIWRECYVVGQDEVAEARLMCDVYEPAEARYAELVATPRTS